MEERNSNFMKVLKRDGRTEEFIIEKVVTSIVKTGAPAEIARKIAKEVEELVKSKEKISTKEIKDYILKRLKELNERWYENWLKYDEAVKKRIE